MQAGNATPRPAKLDRVVGAFVIIILPLVVYAAIKYLPQILFAERPKASVALSAWFDSGSKDATASSLPCVGRLRIEGRVQREGAPVKSGLVKLTVEKWKGGFEQSIQKKLNGDGIFESFDNPAFCGLKDDDSLVIDAEVWTAGDQAPLVERIYLNSPVPTWIRKRTVYSFVTVVLILLATFLWVFTGPNNASKNRVAIMFSYFVIFISLLCAFLAPVLLVQAIPFNQDPAETKPVGIVMARLTKDSPPEWMLNIGGIVEREGTDEATGEKSTDGTEKENRNPGGETERKAEPSASENEKGIVSAETQAGNTPEFPVVNAPILRLLGGIQVPLYVLILSVVGGAINMARQVPKYQGQQPEGAPLIPAVGAKILSAPRRMAAALTAREEPPVEVDPEAGGGASNPQSTEIPVTDSGAITPEPTTPESTAVAEKPWRIGLLDQYMFLLSAPFLGIATYYLLLWLDLTQTPIIVLVSFSIGLIADLIIGTITGTASGFLKRTEPDKPVA